MGYYAPRIPCTANTTGVASAVAANYATTRNATPATTTPGGATTGSIGQTNSAGNSICTELFLTFDTSAVPTGLAGFTSATIFLNCTTVANASASTDYLEVYQVSSSANSIGGDTLATMTPLGSMPQPTVAGAFYITIDPTNMTRSSTCTLCIASRRQRLGTAPVTSEAGAIFTSMLGVAASRPYMDIGGPWTLRNVGTVVESITGTATLTLTEPSGCGAGDLIIAVIGMRSTATAAGSISLPAGWTRIGESYTNNVLTTSSAVPSGTVAYIIRGSSAPSYAFPYAVGNSVIQGQCVAYWAPSDRTISTDVVGPATMSSTSGIQPSVAGITTLTADALLIHAIVGGQESQFNDFTCTDPNILSGPLNSTRAPTAAWQRRFFANTTSGADVGIGIADAIKVTAGATGNFTCGATQGAFNLIFPFAFKLSSAGAISVNVTGAGLTATAGTAGGAGPTTFNPLDKKDSNVALSNGNLTVTGNGAANNWARSIRPRSGKRYVEFTITTVANSIVGISDGSPIASYPGIDATSFGLFANGAGSINNTFPSWGPAYTTGDVVGMAVDFTAKLVWYRKNGGAWNGTSGDPTAGTGGNSISAYTGTTHYVVASEDVGGVLIGNFGATAFQTAAPTGYLAWDGTPFVSPGVTSTALAISPGTVTVTAAKAISPGVTSTGLTTTAGSVTVNIVAGGGAPWTPAQIPTGNVLWLDGADSSKLTFSGSNLTQWTDKSPAANNVTPFTTGPTLTSVNGLGSLQFSSQNMRTASAISFGDFFVTAVFRPTSTADAGAAERLVDHDYQNGWWLGQNVTAGGQDWGGGIRLGVAPYGYFVPLPDGQVHQVSSRRTGTSQTVSGNGGASTSTQACDGTATTSNVIGIGGGFDNTAATDRLNDEIISEVLIWSRSLTTDETAKVEGYLAWKWGIQASLPVGHPYKSAAPTVAVPVSVNVTGDVVTTSAGTVTVTAKGSTGVTSTALATTPGSVTVSTPAGGTVTGQNIHGSGAYTGTENNDGTSGLTLAFVFAAVAPVTITGVRFWKTSIDDRTFRAVAIYDNTGTAVATGLSSGEPVGTARWITIPLTTPLVMTGVGTGTSYCAAVYFANEVYPATPHYYDVGHYSADGKLYALQGAEAPGAGFGGNGMFNYATGISFPTGGFNNGDYWIDVEYSYSTGGGTNVSANVTGDIVTTTAGTVSVTAKQFVSTNVTSTALGITAGTVTVNAKASTNVTGDIVTTTAGTVTVVGKASVNVTGDIVTTTAGTVTVTAKQFTSTTVTGQALATTAGTVTVTTKQAPSVNVIGDVVTASAGSVSVAAGGSISAVAPGGVATTADGTVTVVAKQFVSTTLTGVALATTAGTVTVTAPVLVNVTGSIATTSAGTVSVTTVSPVSALVTVTGQSVTASAGSVSVTGKANVTVTGSVATTSAGSVNALMTTNAPVTGQAISTSAGTVTVFGKANVTLLGEQLTISDGVVDAALGVTVPVTGRSANTSVGSVVVAGDANVEVTDLQIKVRVGVPTFKFDYQLAITGVQATVRVGFAQSPNWGSVPDDKPENWSPLTAGTREEWTPVDHVKNDWTPVPTTTPQDWTEADHPKSDWTRI